MEQEDKMTQWQFYRLTFLLCGFALFFSCFSSRNASKQRLVWSEEFNYKGLPDTTKWGYDLGDGCPNICGWGNNELQYYTAHRAENARVENGCLVIEAHRERMGAKEYTSARLVSRQKGDWTYGRIEVRAKLPKGLGVWPAIWMLPSEWHYGGWPESGEIDIMENVGYMPDSVLCAVHTLRYNGMKGSQKTGALHSNTLSSDFHEYRLEWDADKMDFFFDGQRYQRFQNNHEGFESWPFDQKFHLLLNIAIGGNWGGKMGVDTAVWPQQMLVDYVRVYQ
jgi:beta-glucanase (GH16 family)